MHYYNVFGHYAFYAKRTVMISVFSLFCGALNIILNYQFIPEYGYIAAAYTTLFCFALLALLHYLNSRFILKLNVIRLRPLLPKVAIFYGFLLIYLCLTHLGFTDWTLFGFKVITFIAFALSLFNEETGHFYRHKFLKRD